MQSLFVDVYPDYTATRLFSELGMNFLDSRFTANNRCFELDVPDNTHCFHDQIVSRIVHLWLCNFQRAAMMKPR